MYCNYASELPLTLPALRRRTLGFAAAISGLLRACRSELLAGILERAVHVTESVDFVLGLLVAKRGSDGTGRL